MKIYSAIFLISSLFVLSCRLGASKEQASKFAVHKEFVKKLSFSGSLSGKKICSGCAPVKYQIIVDLIETFPKDIDSSMKAFEPYYSFNDKNQLVLAVPKNIYESALNGLVCKKLLNSDNLVIVGYNYSLLSREEDKWLIGE